MGTERANPGLSVESRRNATIDILRGLAILCVIFTHLPGTSLRYNFVFWWPYAFFINMAVPVFMILMGYCAAMSAEKHAVVPLQMYSPSQLIHKCRRYFLPWFPLVLLELPGFFLTTEGKCDFMTQLRFFVSGGIGPGNYYIPILFQFLLIFPLFYAMRKHIFIISFILNLLFELIVLYTKFPVDIYRLCIGRYFFLIGCGMSLYYEKDRSFGKGTQTAMTLAGVAYLIMMTFLLDFGRVYPQWWATMMFVGLYLYFPCRYIILNNAFERIADSKVGKLLAGLGVASYHIFLIQMVYYFYLYCLRDRLNIRLAAYNIIGTLLAFPVCVILGIWYCRAEKFVLNMGKAK